MDTNKKADSGDTSDFLSCSDNYDFHCYIHMAVVAVLFMARAANDPSVFTITEKAPTRG